MNGQKHALQTPSGLNVRVHTGADLEARLPHLETFAVKAGRVPLSRHPAWLNVLQAGLGHRPYCLEALEGETTRGFLPLAYVSSFLFGRFLVSLPYLNHGGVFADDDRVASRLIDRAVGLADELKVRYLELRQGEAIEHPMLSQRMTSKVHMRLSLPESGEALWKQLSAKVRNQVRKGEKSDLKVQWGAEELLADFFAVFSQNMRDLGTPTYGKKFFASILREFPGRAELCVLKSAELPLAAALLLHGWGITEVPSASTLRSANPSCANMLMYWKLLERTVERRQALFDFGRSSRDSNTYRFKKQWGAQEGPADWQYYLRQGSISDMRPDNPRYQRMIRIWRRLPLAVTRWIGPRIVRGIP